MSKDGMLSQVATTTIQTLIDLAEAEQRADLERRLEIIRELDLDSDNFSPADFLTSEVARALGV